MAYTSQPIGRVERKHRHLLDTARALRSHANFPIRFWGDCILAATYLINKMPVKILDWRSPFEKLYGIPPTYDHLRVIGCLCYAVITKPHKDKFDDEGIKCVLLGYPINQKGYNLYNWETMEVFLSRDVIFEEIVFPFKQFSSSMSFTIPPTFPNFGTTPLDDTKPINPNTPLLDNNDLPTAPDIPNPTSTTPLVSNADNATQNEHVPPMRKSSRQSTKPAWLKDFVAPTVATSNFVSPHYPLIGTSYFKGIPQTHIAFLENVFTATDPTYKQASKVWKP
ncbi:retrovirus-related pol polyprotein from transposon TNT 1-94 [Tanacetum coccineum]